MKQRPRKWIENAMSGKYRDIQVITQISLKRFLKTVITVSFLAPWFQATSRMSVRDIRFIGREK